MKNIKHKCFNSTTLRVPEQNKFTLLIGVRQIRSASSQKLQKPNAQDAQAILDLMDKRKGSIVTTFALQENYTASIGDLEKYNIDWTKRYRGSSSIVAKPNSVDQVSSILKYCHDNYLGVVPQGGNTGLVGGSVPVQDEIVLSTELLNQHYSLDPLTGILTCEAGCILQQLQEYVQVFDRDNPYLLPIDLGSKGSCQIGGNVSTNAGGQYYYRFGSLHANVVGLEVVLADGTILDCNISKVNHKDNTGYDLKQLFIGAEGTLGIVTKVAISCPRLPVSKQVAFLGCDSFEDVVHTMLLAKARLGEILAAFEFMDSSAMELLKKDGIPALDDGSVFPFGLLVETQGSNEEHDNSKMQVFLESAMNSGFVVDGVIAQDGKQIQDMWALRESLGSRALSEGYIYKYDISLPLGDFYDIVHEMKHHLRDFHNRIRVCNWGHVIDGNLHFNVFTPGKYERDDELLSMLEPYIFHSVIRRKGSISAEHGLGQCKNKYLDQVKSQAAVSAMTSIKQIFDPRGILNPGKVFP